MWKWARKLEARFTEWRDQRHFVTKHLLLIPSCLLLVAVIEPIMSFLISQAKADGKPTGSGFLTRSKEYSAYYGDLIYFSFQWVTTLGIGDFRVDTIMGSRAAGSVLLVQILVLAL
jgi:hypothetical protein